MESQVTFKDVSWGSESGECGFLQAQVPGLSLPLPSSSSNSKSEGSVGGGSAAPPKAKGSFTKRSRVILKTSQFSARKACDKGIGRVFRLFSNL